MRTSVAGSRSHHDLRLLRRRMLVQSGSERGESVVRMVPDRAGKANQGHACVKGRFAYGYATHEDRVSEADGPRQDHRPLARSELG